jgi:hypothetical protein
VTLLNELRRQLRAADFDVRRPLRPERGGAPDDSEGCEVEPLVDCAAVVETAIAAALKLAAEAQQWDIVAQLALELEARRAIRSDGGQPSGTVIVARQGTKGPG